MSNSNSYSEFSYVASSYTSSSFSQSSSADPEGTTKRFTETMTSNDRDGTSVRRTHEETGKPTLQDEMYIPPGGRTIEGTGAAEKGRIEDVSDADAERHRERDREYEERMEEEYAKREGGA
ncbi:uncharacterized protein Z518_08285 [Rhinocladiella mackenziei CBS 650.93]|uniref:Uncharacterized protein n=1 Tax=Rhinocladiella mackenziei CBS 650.93 TaxID=1442369 RepID=A0A0D2I927_9EURO|nr:uncharacterized protein Z518_08285 [Rhinocladiella mackenziei CBS 650.93]KIX02344.1 hypothetical protein Z518_08285 [Rhinocladiella mackenziei CBS 650.93]